MALDDYKIDNWTDPVINMPDRPGADGYGAEDVKTWFDSNSNQLKNSLNGLITELEDYVDEDHGVFIAAVGDTTYAEVDAAVTAGRTVLVNDYTLHITYLLCNSGASGADHWYEFASVDHMGIVWYCILGSVSGWTDGEMSSLAPIHSPNFSGNPTAPTQAAGNNSQRIANTQFVQTAIGNAAEIFYATYGTTTYAEITAALSAGKVPVCFYSSRVYILTRDKSPLEYRFYANDAGAVYEIICTSSDVWSANVRYIQAQITANGLLKRDYLGNIIAAVAGTDYQTPLPSQTGNSGKFLTTDGTDMSWAAVSAALPSQTGNSGKFLTTDGTDASWAEAPKEIFYATYGTTTYADISTAITAGKIPVCIYGDDYYYLSGYSTSGSPYFYEFMSVTTMTQITKLYFNNNGTWDTKQQNLQKNITASGLLKGDGLGGVTAATSGTDYQAPLVAGTDYQTPLPSQTGNSGKFLSTNGTSMSWETAGSALPSQTGNTGKFLTTDGTDASWAAAPTDIFVAEYGTTTFAEVTAAVSAGKIPVVWSSGFLYIYNRTMGSGNEAVHYFYFVSQTRVYQMTCEYDDSWHLVNVQFAPKDSPALTGTPTAPTASSGTNTTQIATTEFVTTAISTAIVAAIGEGY